MSPKPRSGYQALYNDLCLIFPQLLLFTTGISLVLIVPVGMLTAISNNEIGLNVLCEMIGGFISPGKALAVNMFKAYGTLTLVQAIGFLDALKMGHYVKIPPRAMFRAQTIPTLFSVIIVSLPFTQSSFYPGFPLRRAVDTERYPKMLPLVWD